MGKSIVLTVSFGNIFYNFIRLDLKHPIYYRDMAKLDSTRISQKDFSEMKSGFKSRCPDHGLLLVIG